MTQRNYITTLTYELSHKAIPDNANKPDRLWIIFIVLYKLLGHVMTGFK